MRGANEDILYQRGFALPRETQATYVSPSQTFPFNYEPSQGVNTLGMVMREPKTGTDLVDPLAVPDLDELMERGKLPQEKTLEKYDLLKERMRVME